MLVYHYTHFDDLRRIFDMGGTSRSGLRARRRMGHYDLEAFQTGAVFALLEPTPKDWVGNQDFPGIWQFLKEAIGPLLLEVAVDVHSKDAFVVDRGHMEGVFYQGIPEARIPMPYAHITQEEAERAYIHSKIPLADYLQRRGELSYSLPEVIITDHVPLENVRIAEEQPLIEERWEEYVDYRRTFLRTETGAIPGLDRLHAKYAQKLQETWPHGAEGPPYRSRDMKG